jgi:hypothetical protein
LQEGAAEHAPNGARDLSQIRMSCVRQRVLRPDLLAKLELRLREMARAEQAADRPARDLAEAGAAAADVDRQLATVARNMALAATEEQRQATAMVFDELQARKRKLAGEAAAAAERARGGTADAAA